jgi:RNA polymerase sigma factor (TIGR02999 family)
VQDPGAGAVTELLHRWQGGEAECFDQLSGMIYHELHRIAEGYLRGSPNATLQPTALINEAYIRLIGVSASLQGRKHFFALAAKLMRQILVDRARRHSAARRGGAFQFEPLNEQVHGVEAELDQFLILDQALTRLSEQEPHLARIVELHYFGGLTASEVAELLDVAPWTVTRDHRLAEAWLRRALSEGQPEET